MLKQNNYTDLINEIEQSTVVRDIIKQSNIIQENNRLCNMEKDFYISPYFSYENVMNRLHSYLHNPITCNHNYICDLLIAFAARPHELFEMKLLDDGYIVGYGKSRTNKPIEFLGLLNVTESQYLLSNITVKYNALELYNYTTRHYKMKPSQFRKIGAEYISRQATNAGESRYKKKVALRHTSISTSIMHYDIKHPTNVFP
jgi:hypothetical protein